MSIAGVVDTGDHRNAVALSVRRIANVIYLTGEVDVATVPVFRRALRQCDRDLCTQALDMTGVFFFSAAGVNSLVRSGWATRPHDPIIASPAVRRVLELCDLEFLLSPHGWTGAFDGWALGGAWLRRPDRG